MWPGIKFMGQLNYAAKFGLISFLFMVPLVVLSGQVFLAAFESLKKTEQELNGVDDVRRLLDFAHFLEDTRDLAAVTGFQLDDDLKLTANAMLESIPKRTADIVQRRKTHHWHVLNQPHVQLAVNRLIKFPLSAEYQYHYPMKYRRIGCTA